MAVIVVAVAFASLVVNAAIFIYVYSSSRRVQPVNNVPQVPFHGIRLSRIRRRDMYLLRHVIFMFVLFMGGWGPINILGMIQLYTSKSYPLFYTLLVIWTEICLLGDMINLFVYNRELRLYLTRTLRRVSLH